MADRWQSSAKWTLVAVVGVVVLGGAAFWWFVLRGDEPSRASLPVRTTDSTVVPAGAAPTGADGTFTVSPGSDVFVGYRVQELFGGETIKKTAVGRTAGVTGAVTIANGQVTVVDITADMTRLTSDSSTRDNALRNRGLQTEQFPTATFRLTAPIALPGGLAPGRPVDVVAVGDLTLHGVTRSVQVPLQASWDGADTVSVASPEGLTITMADYDIEPPSNPLVTVDGEGELELQLVLVRS